MADEGKKELLEQIRLDSERYYNLAKEFYKNWVENKKCECCNDELIVSGKCVLSCKHHQEASDEYTKDLCKKWNEKINLLCAINLSDAYRDK